MIVHSTNWPPEGYELIGGKCPNVGRACNCIGLCHPTLQKKELCGKPTVQAGTDGHCTKYKDHIGVCVDA